VIVVQAKSSETEVRSFPPVHQLQLNNRRKPVVTAATTTDTQSAVSWTDTLSDMTRAVLDCDRDRDLSVKHLYSAPSKDTATSEALRYMAGTKQRRTYLPYTFPAIAGTHLPTPRGWRIE